MASRPFTVAPRLSAGPPGRISPLPVVWCLGPATPLQNSRTPLVYDRDWLASVLSSKLPFPPCSQFHCITGFSNSTHRCYHIFGCQGFSPFPKRPKHHFFSPLFAVFSLATKRGLVFLGIHHGTLCPCCTMNGCHRYHLLSTSPPGKTCLRLGIHTRRQKRSGAHTQIRSDW